MNFSKFASLTLFVQLMNQSLAKTTETSTSDQDRRLQLQRQRQAVANGDDVTDPSRYPYFARIDFNGIQGCGGALIHPEFVLSAAHCFPDPDELVEVYLGGVLDVYDVDSSKKAQAPMGESKVKVFRHPLYDYSDATSDIALVKIAPVTMVEPAVFDSSNGTFIAGDAVTVVGFGKMETGNYADILQEVQLFVTSDDKCNTENKRTGGIDGPSMICALDAADNQDACGNDSGGPLLILGNGPGEDVVVGVVNSGDASVPCGQPVASGVYTETAYFADWIQYTICQNAENPPPAGSCNITDPTLGQDPIKLSSGGTNIAATTSAVVSFLALLVLW